MAASHFERAWLDQQADEIEQILADLSFPTRIQGGEVAQDRIRYHAAPMLAGELTDIRAMEENLSRAMGIPHIRLASDEEGLEIEIPRDGEADLRLLPMLHALGDLMPMSAVLGMTSDGHPLILNLRNKQTWHLLHEADFDYDGHELERTILISLALTTRQAQLQMLGIDPSGRELIMLEALPHALAHVAISSNEAAELCQWLAEELERRTSASITRPDLVVFLGEDAWKEGFMRPAAHSALAAALRYGHQTGIHLIGFMPGEFRASRANGSGREGIVRAHRSAHGGRGQAASYIFECRNERFDAELAWLSARDLDTSIRLAASGWQASRRNHRSGKR